MTMEKVIFVCLIILLGLFMYGTKYRFRNGSRVRYLKIFKKDGAYMSYDAFWKFKYLKRKFIGPIGRATLWSFVPVEANRLKVTDEITLVARGYFKDKTVVLKAAKPIKELFRMSREYHISVNKHFSARETSRRISNPVPFNGSTAELEYSNSYLVLLEDNTGYILKIRK